MPLGAERVTVCHGGHGMLVTQQWVCTGLTWGFALSTSFDQFRLLLWSDFEAEVYLLVHIWFSSGLSWALLHFNLFFCSLYNCLLSSCCVLRAILNVRNQMVSTTYPLRSWYWQCGVRSIFEKQACFITTPNHHIMKDFKHSEKLKVLPFWNDRCSAELTVFTDTTVNMGVTQRCQRLLLRVLGVKTHITRIWIKKNKQNVGVCSVEGWESQALGKGVEVSGTLSSWHGFSFCRWKAFCLAIGIMVFHHRRCPGGLHGL